MNNPFVSLFAITVALLTSSATAVSADSYSGKSAAILVANRTTASQDAKIPVIEDLVISMASDLGMSIISPEIVLNAVSSLAQGSATNEIDRQLSDQTSSLRLAQTLGANYIFFVTLISYDTDERNVNAYGVQFKNTEHKLRLSYRIIDGNSGETITAKTTTASRAIQEDSNAQVKSSGIFADLAEKAATDIATDLKAKLNQDKIRDSRPADALTSFHVAVSLSDINFPEVIFDENGEAVITANRANVEALAVTVEIDGITVGTTGTGQNLTGFQAPRGLHRLRLSREDLVPWERMVNITEGMKFNVSMQLTDDGLKRWKERTQFLENLKRDALLTRGEAAVLQAEAKMLEQSGYKVDIKVDTTEGVRIEDNRSLIGGKLNEEQ